MSKETEFTEELAHILDETKDKVKLSLLLIVKELGIKKCLAILDEAIEAYEKDELICDGTRPRTFGGCFFYRVPKKIRIKNRRKIRNIMSEIKKRNE